MFFLSDTPIFECPNTIANIMNHLELCANEHPGGRRGLDAISVLLVRWENKQKMELQELDDGWLAHQAVFQNAALAKRSS